MNKCEKRQHQKNVNKRKYQSEKREENAIEKFQDQQKNFDRTNIYDRDRHLSVIQRYCIRVKAFSKWMKIFVIFGNKSKYCHTLQFSNAR